MTIAIILAVVIVLAIVASAPAVADAVYHGTGKRILKSNTGSAIVSKDVVVVASGTSGMIGIAVADIAATTGTGQLEIDGEWELPKTSGQAYTFGQVLYWTGSALSSTATSTSTRAGRCSVAAASAATTARILLNRN